MRLPQKPPACIQGGFSTKEKRLMFVAGQAALAEDDQARVYFHVQKTDEVARVGCHDRKVVF